MYKILIFIIQILIIAAIALFYYTGNFEDLLSSNLYTIYSIIILLTLPSLLSKTLFGQGSSSWISALCFTYYPLMYLIAFGLSSKTSLSLNEVYSIIGVFTALVWNLLVAAELFLVSENEDQKGEKVYILLFPLLLLWLLLLLFVTGREINSVASLDFMQHKAVINGMGNEKLCLLPIDCSNLFRIQGYTTFYHSVIGMLFYGFKTEFVRAAFWLDLVFPLIACFHAFKLIKQHAKNGFWAMAGTLIALFVFDNGAYTLYFLIPQTFTFLLFLQILNSKTLSKVGLFLSIILMSLAHFVMGPFLSILLIARYYFINKSSTNMRFEKFILLFAFINLFIVFLINLGGFSVEQYFQSKSLDAIGQLTNSYYPESLFLVMRLFGFASLIILVAVLVNYKSRVSGRNYWAIFYIIFALITYFLAPTYAHKFLIGAGIIVGLLIATYLSHLKLKPVNSYIILTTLVISLTINFTIQYDRYIQFYTDETGNVSAVTETDQKLVDALLEKEIECFTISDTYTQLIVSTFTNNSTARAHYQSLETRVRLQDFIRTPSDRTLENLLESDDVVDFVSSNEDICFLYTGRMERSLKTESELFSIYSYELNFDEIDKNSSDVVRYLEEAGADEVLTSSKYILYRLP